MKKMKLKMRLLAIVFCLGSVGISFAQSKDRKQKTPPTFAELLEEMDSGKDGKLSAVEVKGPLKKIFSDVDTNDDGYITKEEFEKAPKPKRRRQRNK